MARIAFIVADEFEDSEVAIPLTRLRRAGHQVDILGVEGRKKLVGKRGKEKLKTDGSVSDFLPEMYDAVVIPGGHSPDHLRMSGKVVDFVRQFAALDRPIAAVCHGPQLLIEADLVRGKRVTSWPSIRKDLHNAGAIVEDQSVVEDGNLITSRMPEDLEAFTGAILRHLAEQVRQRAA